MKENNTAVTGYLGHNNLVARQKGKQLLLARIKRMGYKGAFTSSDWRKLSEYAGLLNKPNY